MARTRLSITIHLMRCAGLLFVISVFLALCPDSRLRATLSMDPTTRLPSLPSAAQFAISAAIGRNQSDYLVTTGKEGYQAYNPAHRLIAFFDTEGAHIEGPNGVVWNPGVRAVGRGTDLAGVGDLNSLEVNENRVEYRYGGLTEWYVNGPLGLEQGFTLAAPPPGSTQERVVTLVLDLDELTVQLDAPASSSTLLTQDGSGWLRYAGLSAFDAAGKELRAWFEIAQDYGMSGNYVSPGTRRASLLVRVDDAGAHYPLTIDPWIQAAKLTASDGVANDFFGMSVAVSGDTIVVGAPKASIGAIAGQGVAYVFVKPVAGWATATQTAKLTASDGASGDLFGGSVAISGNTIVVGAQEHTVGPYSHQGAAYVFVKPSAGWANSTQTVELTAADGALPRWFGSSVAIDGDTIVVGAPHESLDGMTGPGYAYVFVKPALGWASTTPTAKLSASDGAPRDRFGSSVAVSGDALVVGAPQHTVGINANQGAAYVFAKPNGGWATTTETRELIASGGGAGNSFGHSVAISGDTIVVGNYDRIDGVSTYQGSARVFVKPVGGWVSATETAKLTSSNGGPTNGQATDGFSTSLAISGNTIAVSAPNHTVGSNIWQGAVYVFLKPAGGWTTATETAQLTIAGDPGSWPFGWSVGVSGNTIAAGAYLSAVGGNANQGAAYVFTRNAPTTTTISSVLPEPSVVGESVLVNFTVSAGGSGAATGDVTVTDSASAATCTGTVAAGSCSITFNTAGPRALVAHYAGDGNFDPSVSAGVTHTVWNTLYRLHLPMIRR